MNFRSCQALKTKNLFSPVLNELLINKLLIHFFRLKEVLLVTLLPLGALVTLVILVTTKDQMIQDGSCCPTEPKLEPNHLGVLQVLQQEREAETEMAFVDDPLTNPDLVTQVRINTMGMGIKAELPREGILFCTQFPPLGIFLNKKVEFQKTKTT